MDANSMKKIAILSDTHRYLSDNVYSTLNGHYDSDSVYDSQILQALDDKKISEIVKIKDLRANKCPDLIIHAGDIGKQDIVDQLETIAPLIAVQGNCDYYTYQTMRGETKEFEYFNYEGISIALTHCPQDLQLYIKGNILHKSLIPDHDNIPNLWIHGHTHQSHITSYDNHTVICPGSATQGRYGCPNSIAFLYIYEKKLYQAELIEV